MRVLHPALATLARLKWRGFWRAQGRRFRRPSGWIFGVLGLLLALLWIGSLVLRAALAGGERFDPELARAAARAALFAIGLLSVLGALSHRGLYLPQGEIERLLSAPIPRRDLIRYRLVINILRSLPFALITALVTSMRMPLARYAFPGTVVAVLALPILGQAAALVLGDVENRLGALVKRVPVSLLRIVVVLCFWALVMLFVVGEDWIGPIELDAEGRESPLRAVLLHPVIAGLTAPAAPWAAAIAARDLGSFLPWFAFAVLFLGLAFEATARIPVDFRALTLETSANVAQRLARMRSGRGLISGARARAGWRVPWLFGRGPFGAVAWLRTAGILRKARGTLVFTVFIVALVTWIGTSVIPEPLGGAVFMVMLGTIYLASGLRFDFRGDLDMMTVIRAWPLAAWRVFLASVVPVAALVALLVDGALLAREAFVETPSFAVFLAAAPVAGFIWVAIDNAVFLVFPVRFVPGQGGAMHHVGRSLVLVLVRLGALASLGGAALAAWWLGAWQLGPAGGAAGVLLVVAAGLAAVVWAGGRALARFDVGRSA